VVSGQWSVKDIKTLLVPKLYLGNAPGRQAPAWRESGGPGACRVSGKAGASPENWVPKPELGNQIKTHKRLFPSKGGHLPAKNIKYFKIIPVLFNL